MSETSQGWVSRVRLLERAPLKVYAYQMVEQELIKHDNMRRAVDRGWRMRVGRLAGSSWIG